MKKIFLNNNWLALMVAVSIILPSCLKDKDNEDMISGPQNTEGQEWVTIPKGNKAANVLAIEAKSEPQDVNLFQVSYDYVDPASTDITTTLVVNNDLVTAYDPTAIVLPANAYTMPSPSTVVRERATFERYVQNRFEHRSVTGSNGRVWCWVYYQQLFLNRVYKFRPT